MLTYEKVTLQIYLFFFILLAQFPKGYYGTESSSKTFSISISSSSRMQHIPYKQESNVNCAIGSSK